MLPFLYKEFMALKTVSFSSPVCLFVTPCDEVVFCVKAPIVTASGRPFLVGTLQHSARKLGLAEEYCKCPSVGNPRGEDKYQYVIEYEDTQLVDPEQSLCEQICGVSDDPCFKLLLDQL